MFRYCDSRAVTNQDEHNKTIGNLEEFTSLMHDQELAKTTTVVGDNFHQIKMSTQKEVIMTQSTTDDTVVIHRSMDPQDNRGNET